MARTDGKASATRLDDTARGFSSKSTREKAGFCWLHEGRIMAFPDFTNSAHQEQADGDRKARLQKFTIGARASAAL